MLTAYCKKCKQDVTPGDACPLCGGKLTRASQRVTWEIAHDPVKDWMCWNSAARIALPVMALTAALLPGLEGISGGAAALHKLVQGGMLHLLGGAVVVFFLVVWLVLLLQGEETLRCTVDSKGIHVTAVLDSPAPLQLALRMKPASGAADEPVEVWQRDLPWKDIARVQLWEDKLLILFYAPVWWMRLSLPATADAYPAVILYLHDKLGKKKNLRLPDVIRAPGEEMTAMAAVPAQEVQRADAAEPVWEPAPEPAWLPPAEEAPSADALPEDQVAGGEQGSMFE
ncbi:MAG: hypothetical protein IKK21_05150 [Clostridia bacterium]|nr:hypothetical protein [Clostridia bacterium]